MTLRRVVWVLFPILAVVAIFQGVFAGAVSGPLIVGVVFAERLSY